MASMLPLDHGGRHDLNLVCVCVCVCEVVCLDLELTLFILCAVSVAIVEVCTDCKRLIIISWKQGRQEQNAHLEA
jgi:hypothetical protein